MKKRNLGSDLDVEFVEDEDCDDPQDYLPVHDILVDECDDFLFGRIEI